MKRIAFFTDGSYRHKTNMGGWAYVSFLEGGRVPIFQTMGYETVDDTNSAIMEVVAVQKVCDLLLKNKEEYSDFEVVIFTDSESIKTVSESQPPISGLEHKRQWKKIYSAINSSSLNITIEWVKGHDGNYGNEIANRIAKEASIKNNKENLELIERELKISSIHTDLKFLYSKFKTKKIIDNVSIGDLISSLEGLKIDHMPLSALANFSQIEITDMVDMYIKIKDLKTKVKEIEDIKK